MRDPIEESGPEPPPCEWSYRGRLHLHPRYPSGDCTVCGATAIQGCQYEGWLDWEKDQTGEEPR